MMKEYRERLIAALNGGSTSNLSEERKKGEFCLVVKKYDTLTGVSYNMHKANSREIFCVKGLYG